MKNFKWMLAVLLPILFISLVYAVSETHTTGTRSLDYTNHKNTAANYSTLKKVTLTQTGAPPADFTETLDSIHGIVLRIVIDVTGTDGNYTITLADENGITIFTKANLDSDPSVDFSFAVFEDDTEGNPWAGVAVGGTMSLTMADGDDASLTAITVSIYYLDFWK